MNVPQQARRWTARHFSRTAEQGDERTQFRWFVTLWVIAFSAHFFESRPLGSWPVLLAGIPCLIAPGSVLLFASFLAVSAAVVALRLPAPANHMILGLVVNVAFAASAVALVRMRRRSSARTGSPGFTEQWVDAVRAPAGLTLVVVYFFAVFHKLNTSFFDPAVSCAGDLMSQLFALHTTEYVRLPDALIVGNAALTIACEAAILVCLALPRLRRWGVLLGVLFHTGLAAAMFYDFASFVFALYVLLLPRETFMRIRRPESWRRVALGGYTAFAAVAFLARFDGTESSPVGLTWHTLKFGTWLLAVAPILVPLLVASFTPSDAPYRSPSWRLRPVWLVIVPVIAFLNGATSYLGVKTVANYSMFSNLRTEEGQSNHLVLPAGAVEVTNHLRDTVDVYEIEVPDPGRRSVIERAVDSLSERRVPRWIGGEEPVRVPWIELRRNVLLWKDADIHDIRIRYSHGGRERRVTDAITDPELTQPLSFWTRRLLAFREIERGDAPVQCRW